MPEVAKVSSVVTYDDELPFIKSNDHLNKWPCEVTLQIKNIKSHFSQYPLSLDLSG